MGIQLPQPGLSSAWEDWARLLVVELENNLGAAVTVSSGSVGGTGLPILDSQGRAIVDTDGIHIFDTNGYELVDGGIVRIDTSHLVDTAITTAKLANLAVSTEKLAALAVDASKLGNSAVTSTKIANLAVGTAAIQAAAVGTAQIANLAVTSALIGNAAIVSAKIADLAVTDAKILSITANKLTAGTIDAGVIQVINLSANNINTGTLNANNVTISNLNASNITAGVLNASRINLDGTSLVNNSGVVAVGGVDFTNQVTGADKPEAGATRNVWKGTWQGSGVSYAVGDIVSYLGRAYTCTTANTSTGANGPSGTTADTANWDLFVDAGSTATPVANTASSSGGTGFSMVHNSLGNGIQVTLRSNTFGAVNGNVSSPTSGVLAVTSGGTSLISETIPVSWQYDGNLDASFFTGPVFTLTLTDTPGAGNNTYVVTWTAGNSIPITINLDTLEYP